jgi:hypothetical protein
MPFSLMAPPPGPLELPLGKSGFDHEVATLDVPKVVEPLAERTHDGEVRGQAPSAKRYPIRQTFTAYCAPAPSGSARARATGVSRKPRRSTIV